MRERRFRVGWLVGFVVLADVLDATEERQRAVSSHLGSVIRATPPPHHRLRRWRVPRSSGVQLPDAFDA
jgi:hypothetical protein